MATYVFSGKYTAEAIKGISAKRTEEAGKLMKQLGGEILSMYVLLGEKDVLIIANLPGAEQAFKASVTLSKSTGIGFSTSQAIPVDEFDKLMKGV
ncbi:MAG: GYD domain-containing protein [Bacteroidales bacterium]|nr:GYD domain-containing protein [Bacteroidales bacterium]